MRSKITAHSTGEKLVNWDKVTGVIRLPNGQTGKLTDMAKWVLGIAGTLLTAFLIWFWNSYNHHINLESHPVANERMRSLSREIDARLGRIEREIEKNSGKIDSILKEVRNINN